MAPSGLDALRSVFPTVDRLYQICQDAPNLIPEHAYLPPDDTIPCTLSLETKAEFDIPFAGQILACSIRKALIGSIETADNESVMPVYISIGRKRHPLTHDENYIRIFVLADIPLDRVPGLSQRLYERLPFAVLDEEAELDFEIGNLWRLEVQGDEESRLTYRMKWFARRAVFEERDMGPYVFWSNVPLELSQGVSVPVPAGQEILGGDSVIKMK
ncbi:hypothetical protein BJX70DRAFT_402641 [Aspergillus crustosus]